MPYITVVPRLLGLGSMSGRRGRRSSQPSPSSPASAAGAQEEVGGELSRVLAAIESLTGQVQAVSKRQEEQRAVECV